MIKKIAIIQCYNRKRKATFHFGIEGYNIYSKRLTWRFRLINNSSSLIQIFPGKLSLGFTTSIKILSKDIISEKI